ncbi:MULTISPECIES: hypothetical protein [unclassified Kitasatospora]|uniref:DUF6895 family protein n=1 Tax=unclassified Kitasatospora TaxID=2633591 RepID=UPI0007109EBB|nr:MULTISPECIES: hypothetical protein [unclassified Kitasatospora]KQV04587.1 hypothetical protein ASC99_14420 [Kitasatospora sp. Root107]KRB60886.1 hypothetical protein ASE03_11090 [Kitasatospora sp. Root187]
MTADARLLSTAQRLGSNALHWLHRAHQDGHGALPPDAGIDLSDPDTAYKPIGESALAASLILRDGVAGARDLAAAGELIEFCWHQLQSGNLLYERQLRFPQLTDPLETYAHFARSGYRHRQLDELLASLARLRATHAAELVPNRRLAVANARRVIGLEHRPDWDALTAAGWLGATPEPWAIDWSTGYDLTHTVFHLTDWGAGPDGLPTPLRSYLRDWLPVWVDIWLETGQWDLVGELLIVDSCTGEPVCGLDPWERLAGAQHPDGLTPRDTEPVDQNPARAFKDHEHTAVVAAIAGTVTLARALGGSPVPA